MCEQGKIHSGTSLEQMGKPLHAGAIKAEPGFRGSNFEYLDSPRASVGRFAGQG